MEISEIGTYAGAVWTALNANGEMELAKLKKETKLDGDELMAAVGWLAREGKIQAAEVKKGRRTVAVYSLAIE